MDFQRFLRNLSSMNIDFSMVSLPLDLKEMILLCLYYSKLKMLSATQLAKIPVISHVLFGIPPFLYPSIWHYGPADRLLHRYLITLREEGVIEIKPDESGKRRNYVLTPKGQTYVEMGLLPFDDESNEFANFVAILSSMPSNLLTQLTAYAIGFRKQGALIRVVEPEDFTDIHYMSRMRSKLALHTILFQYMALEPYLKELPHIPEFDPSSVISVKSIQSELKCILVKNKARRNRGVLFELKNCVLNRFLYVVAICTLNLLKKRWATIEEVKLLTHDLYAEAKYKRPYLGNAAEEVEEREIERIRKAGKISHGSVSKDLQLLVRHGFLEEGRSRHIRFFKITALSFTDGKITYYLPKPEWLEEMYRLLCDEIICLNHRVEAMRRGYYGV